jgi:hypothetical protein
VFAERMLRHAGFEGVDRQGVLAAQQLKIDRKDREMENPLLGAHGATALRQKVQIYPRSEPHLAAVTATFSGFQHSAASFMIRAIVTNGGAAVHPAHPGAERRAAVERSAMVAAIPCLTPDLCGSCDRALQGNLSGLTCKAISPD